MGGCARGLMDVRRLHIHNRLNMSDLAYAEMPGNCSASRIIMRIQNTDNLTDDRHLTGVKFLAEIA